MNRSQIIKIAGYLKRIPPGHLLVFLCNGILILGIHLLGYLTPLLQKETIDQAMQSKVLFNSFVFSLLCAYLGFFVLSGLTRVIGIHNHINISRSLFFHTWRQIIFQRKDLLAQKGKGYYFNILSDDLNNVTNLFNEGIFNFLFSSLQSVLILAIVFTWSRILFTGMLILYAVTVGLSVGLTGWRKKHMPGMRETSALFANETVDSLANAFTIRTSVKIEKMKEMMMQKFNRASAFMRKTININNFGALSISCAETAGFLFLILFSLFLIINGRMSYGTLIALISYFKILFKPIENFFSFLSLLTAAEISIDRLNTIQEPESIRATGYENKQLLWDDFRELEFRNIRFSYSCAPDEGNIPASDMERAHICFQLGANDRIGIVGLSGEGKSTILKMLYRELKPLYGQILINNTDIYHLPLLFYFSHINVLTQDAEIFNKDLIFNITCGKEVISRAAAVKAEQTIRDELAAFMHQLEQAFFTCKSVKKGLHRRIKMIIKHYPQFREFFQMLAVTPPGQVNMDSQDTVHSYLAYLQSLVMRKEEFVQQAAHREFCNRYVTRELLDETVRKLELEKLAGRELGENGAFLSGGEKRRILLARFLLQTDYSFFIIDEGFASLDSINEGKLLQIIHDEICTKPGIVISHKFNVLLKLTNRVIVVDNGKAVQAGQHETLLTEDGIYRELYENFIVQREVAGRK